ncbi:hypothetical protein [Pseudomonas izuensis]|uniref:hypothetical protein n=1 Tax=Pseudomonas izuensis TaxID=2684212 RepID=UPI00135A0E5F|nr:hypothetical protein [Pseudomonas izuensis]
MSRSDVSTEQRQPVVSLSPKDVKLRESAGNEFRIIVPAGTPVERLSESSFYAVVAHQFHANDELILIGADRTFWARYLVLQAGQGYCEVFQLSYKKLPAMLCSIGEQLPSNHRLVYMGSEELWSAVRNSDGIVIIKNAISQQDCLQQLLQHASLRT